MDIIILSFKLWFLSAYCRVTGIMLSKSVEKRLSAGMSLCDTAIIRRAVKCVRLRESFFKSQERFTNMILKYKNH